MGKTVTRDRGDSSKYHVLFTQRLVAARRYRLTSASFSIRNGKPNIGDNWRRPKLQKHAKWQPSQASTFLRNPLYARHLRQSQHQRMGAQLGVALGCGRLVKLLG